MRFESELTHKPMARNNTVKHTQENKRLGRLKYKFQYEFKKHIGQMPKSV